MKKLVPIPRSSVQWKALTGYCIAKYILPVDMINDPGFRKMLHTFEP